MKPGADWKCIGRFKRWWWGRHGESRCQISQITLSQVLWTNLYNYHMHKNSFFCYLECFLFTCRLVIDSDHSLSRIHIHSLFGFLNLCSFIYSCILCNIHRFSLFSVRIKGFESILIILQNHLIRKHSLA